MSYLIRRGATYSARLKVPLDLIPSFGKRELVKALGTADREVAKRLVNPVIDQWRREFDDLRLLKGFTADTKAEAAWSHYESKLSEVEERRRSMPTSAQISLEEGSLLRKIDRREITSDDFVGMINASTNYELMRTARKHDSNLRNGRLVALKRELGAGDYARIQPAALNFVTSRRLAVDLDGPDYASLCEVMMRAEIESLERSVERDAGDYSGAVRDPAVLARKDPVVPVAKPGEAIMDVFKQYAAENPKGVKPDTLNQSARDIALFVQVVGKTYPASSISKEDVRNWKKLMIQYPVKAADAVVFRGKSLVEIVAANATVGKPVITSMTVNRHLANLGAFSTWMVNNGYLDQNPVNGMRLHKEANVKPNVFTSEELTRLFSSPLFIGCESSDKPSQIYRPGAIQIRDHQYWVPLILLFTGARPGEIGQLTIDDVKQHSGLWIFDINDDDPATKSLKRPSARRLVPVSDQLIKLGLLEYRKQQVGQGQTRLFPNAVRNTRGQMLADFSRFFPRYLQAQGIRNGQKYSLYSFRHGAIDALRQAGFLDQEIAFLVGQGGKTVTAGYGALREGTIKKRKAMIEAIDYGIDLSHLMPTA